MGRWGEEEKKSKGLMGCFLAFLVLVGFVFGFFRFYDAIEKRKQLEDVVQDTCRGAHTISDSEVKAKIMAAVRDLDLPVAPEQVDVERKNDEQKNQVLEVTIRYEHEVDLLVTKIKLPRRIHEKLTLIDF